MEQTTYYGPKGDLGDETNFLAKHTVFENGEAYWGWFWNGTPYDAYNDYGFRKTSPGAKLTRMTKEQFSNYIKYLKTKNRIYYTYTIRM